MTCDRCHKESLSSIGSFFNQEMICPDCKEREKAHPKYEEAVRAEEAACLRGDYNFPGVGLPAGLRGAR